MSDDTRPVRRALVSVYDKDGAGRARPGPARREGRARLDRLDRVADRDAGIPVTRVEELTGFPECLDGRVKTLHPKVHAGILADLRKPEHEAQLAELGVEPFDLVVVNLYPFVDTVASGATPDECVEQIDIGGPSMVRAAAKNHPSVAVVVSPARYADVLAAVRAGGFTLAQRQALAVEAFAHTATYDVPVASWMGSALEAADDDANFPSWVGGTWERADVLRYGENPHQRAASYVSGGGQPGLVRPTQLHGKEMSYNNYVDADAAWRAAWDHDATRGRDHQARQPVRHRGRRRRRRRAPQGPRLRPGVGLRRGHRGQPPGLGGDGRAGRRDLHRGRGGARLRGRGGRDPGPQAVGAAARVRRRRTAVASSCARSRGGMLLQQARPRRRPRRRPGAWTLACGEAADEATLATSRSPGAPCRSVKSNAILLARDGATVGVGMGQVNRVDSARLAVARAGEDRAHGCGGGIRRVLPVPGRPRGADRGRACGPSSSPVGRCATTRSSRRPRPPA